MSPHKSKPTAISLPDAPPLSDAQDIISTTSVAILTPDPGALGSPAALAAVDEQTGQNALVLTPTALFDWAQVNQEDLLGTAIASKIVAVAVAVSASAGDQRLILPHHAAHWILWANVGWRQYQFAYNLALETGVEVHIRHATVAPPDFLLERPGRRQAHSPLQPASRSNSPLLSATPVFKQGPVGPAGRQVGSRPRTPESRNDENTPPQSLLLTRTGPPWRENLLLAQGNTDLPRGAQGLAPPREDSRGTVISRALPPGAQVPHPPSAHSGGRPIPGMAPLPRPFIGPLPDEDIAIDPTIKKTSQINVLDGDVGLAHSILSHKRAQRGQLKGEELINASLCAKLSYARPLVELEGSFLAVDSNGVPHGVFCECQNPIPLGTDKIITKNSKARTVGGTVGIAGSAVAASATASVAMGKEDTRENQLPTTTSYVSTNCSNRLTGMTFEITPFLPSDVNDKRSALANISVDLDCGVQVAAPERRGEGYVVPLTLTAQWHLRKRGNSSRLARRNQIGFFYVLVHQATEDVWGGDWDRPSKTESMVAWAPPADDTARQTVTGFAFPTLIRQGNTGPTRVLGLKSRLTPNDKGRWLRTLLRRLIPSRLKSAPRTRITVGAYELWGRAGWMALDVEAMFRIPPDGYALDSEGGIDLQELEVKRDPVLSLRPRRGTL